MLKIEHCLLILIVLLLSGCTNYEYNKIELENKIIIDSIKIDNNYSIGSVRKNVNGIVLFDEYGRPDKEGTNTIIGAHSGYGPNAYFNRLIELKNQDKIIVYYNNNMYTYIVKEVKEINDYDINVLNSTGKSIITLLSCKIGDSSKRIIVIANLESSI